MFSQTAFLKTLSPKTKGVLFTVLSAFIYGLYPSTMRNVYADGGNPVFASAITLAARALGLSLFCWITRRPLFAGRSIVRQAFSTGFYQALTVFAIMLSLQYLSGPVMNILLYTHPMLLLGYLVWTKQRPLDASSVALTAIALLGLSFVVDVWHPQNLSLPGVAFALLAAGSTATRFYVYGNMTQTRDPAVVGAEVFLFAALFGLLAVLAFPTTLPRTTQGYFWTSLSCLSMLLGSFGTFYGIAYLGSFQFSLLAKLEPLFTALFAYVICGETLAWRQYAGMAIVIACLTAYGLLAHKLEANQEASQEANKAPAA